MKIQLRWEFLTRIIITEIPRNFFISLLIHSYWPMNQSRKICDISFILSPGQWNPNSVWCSSVLQVTMWPWRRSMEHCWWHSNTVSTVPASILVAWSFWTCNTFPVSRREWPPLGEDYTLHILVIKIHWFPSFSSFTQSSRLGCFPQLYQSEIWPHWQEHLDQFRGFICWRSLRLVQGQGDKWFIKWLIFLGERWFKGFYSSTD